MKKLMAVVGTRPEIIKMAPIIRSLERQTIPSIFVHCGQHYDYSMSERFIEELELPRPDYGHKLKGYSQGVQTARILTYMERLLKRTDPSLVLIEGDTNSVLATALASIKLGTPIGHVEAGLRSFDLRMPEEHNRRVTDHVSTYLFAPTENAKKNLEKENVWGKIYVTGNTVIDAIQQHLPIAKKKSKILQTLNLEKFALATAHRAENVDNIEVLRSFISAFSEAPLPVVYPMHPRTKKRLKEIRIFKEIRKTGNIVVLPPLGYIDFLALMNACQIIITDSGGIQEEATAPCIRKPVLVIRLSTERPEAVKTGFAKIVGTSKEDILRAMEMTLSNKSDLPNESPYGNGTAADQIVEIVKEELGF